jgi:hypothetical protein
MATKPVEAPEIAEPAPVEPPAQNDEPAAQVDWETRAKELQAQVEANANAAKRLAEMEKANKSEYEKQYEEVAALKATVAESSLRLAVASKHGLSVADSALLTGTEAQMETLAARLATPQVAGGVLSKIGQTPNVKPNSTKSFVTQLFSK